MTKAPVAWMREAEDAIQPNWVAADARRALYVDCPNHAANERLYRDLVSLGLHPHHAVGRDATPGSSHAELSWAVAGLTDDQARALGLAYAQLAVFRIEPGLQSVLWCDGSWHGSRAIGPGHALP